MVRGVRPKPPGGDGSWRKLAWPCGLIAGAALAFTLLSAVGASAGTGATATTAYNLVLTYAGAIQNSYTSESYSSDITVNFSESQPVEVKFPYSGSGGGGAGTAEITDTGPATLTASGSISSSGNDNCSISAGSTADVNVLVNSGSVDDGKDTIDASAAMPLSVAQPGNPGGLTLSGSNDNCADRDTAGLAPSAPAQDALAFQSAELPMISNLDMSQLPYSKSFPVQWTTTDSLGGTDQVTITDKFTIVGSCPKCPKCLARAGRSSGTAAEVSGSAAADSPFNLVENTHRITVPDHDSYVWHGNWPLLCVHFVWQARRKGQDAWKTLATTSDPKFTYDWNITGYFEVRAQAVGLGGVASSNLLSLEVRFPSGEQIASDPTVRRLTDDAWNLELQASNSAYVRELGFWIVLDTCDDRYQRTEYIHGKRQLSNGTGDNPDIVLGKRPDDKPIDPPVGGCAQKYTVASFHTHVPLVWWRPVGSRVGVGPSKKDVEADKKQGIPGLVYDYVPDQPDGHVVLAGHPLRAEADVYIIGPHRRDTPSLPGSGGSGGAGPPGD